MDVSHLYAYFLGGVILMIIVGRITLLLITIVRAYGLFYLL